MAIAALSRRSLTRRVGITFAATLAVAVSLLVFPSAVPWMIAFWLLVHSWQVYHRRSGWIPLGMCLVVLVIKGIYWTPGLLVLVGTACVVGLWRLVIGIRDRRKAAEASHEPSPSDRVDRSGLTSVLPPLILMWMALGLMLIDWQRGLYLGVRYSLDPSRPVACLGDSLTAFGYPPELQGRLQVPVVDFGQNGITSEAGIKLLPELLATRPQAVIVELGGHDFLKGRSRAATKANLEKIIRDCRAQDAQVILMEIPRGFIFDSYRGLERQIAREQDLELIPDTIIRRLVLYSPAAPPGMWLNRPWHLSDDGLHPNHRGNQAMAEAVACALANVYGPRILKN